MVENYNPESHQVEGYRCGSCGRNNFIYPEAQEERTDNAAKAIEEGTMPEGQCVVNGCGKSIIKDHMCQRHYIEKHGVSPRKQCEAPDCTKQAVKGGLCANHYREVHGRKVGTTWAKNKKAKPQEKESAVINKAVRGKSPLARVVVSSNPLIPVVGFTEVAPNVLIPAELADVVDQVNTVKTQGEQKSPFPDVAVMPAKCRATLSQEVYDISDGNGRKASIVFSWIDGKKVYCRVSTPEGTLPKGPGDYDDWMFLGDIAGEIRRIQEGA